MLMILIHHQCGESCGADDGPLESGNGSANDHACDDGGVDAY